MKTRLVNLLKVKPEAKQYSKSRNKFLPNHVPTLFHFSVEKLTWLFWVHEFATFVPVKQRPCPESNLAGEDGGGFGCLLSRICSASARARATPCQEQKGEGRTATRLICMHEICSVSLSPPSFPRIFAFVFLCSRPGDIVAQDYGKHYLYAKQACRLIGNIV